MKPKYTRTDGQMGWRFVGSRPVSALADQVMRDCGLPLAGEAAKPAKAPAPRRKQRQSK